MWVKLIEIFVLFYSIFLALYAMKFNSLKPNFCTFTSLFCTIFWANFGDAIKKFKATFQKFDYLKNPTRFFLMACESTCHVHGYKYYSSTTKEKEYQGYRSAGNAGRGSTCSITSSPQMECLNSSILHLQRNRASSHYTKFLASAI